MILSLGFVSSSHDSVIFIKCTDVGRIILSLYVDDMIITSDDIDDILVLKIELARQFEMKDLSYLRYFIGTAVAYSPRGYLSQSKYVADIIEWARLTDNKTIYTLIEVNTMYSSSNDLSLIDPTLYRTIVRSLVYLTIIRPDIAYVVHVVSHFVASPITIHRATVFCILRYLRGTVFQSLLLPSTSSLKLLACSDANHDNDLTDRKSVIGFCIFR
jgi:hypothetical protein